MLLRGFSRKPCYNRAIYNDKTDRIPKIVFEYLLVEMDSGFLKPRVGYASSDPVDMQHEFRALAHCCIHLPERPSCCRFRRSSISPI